MALPTLSPRQDSSSVSNNQLTFALTTLFTPPPDCSRPILKPSGTTNNYWVPGSDGGTTTFFGSAWSCYPDQFYLTGGLVPLYSPGACPSGFDIVSAATPLHPAVTFATCCPDYATLYSGYFCTGTTINEVTTVNNDRSSTILNGKYIFEYPPITLAWESKDLSKFDPPSAPLLAYRSAIATGASIASSPSQSPGDTATKQGATATGSSAASKTSAPASGLSTGAKAGIGVGVAVGVLALIGILVWAILRRRKRKQSQAWPSPNPTAHSGAAASEPAGEERYEKRVNDSDTRWFNYNQPQQDPVHEADANASPWMRPELPSEDVRAELEASNAARHSNLVHTNSLGSK